MNILLINGGHQFGHSGGQLNRTLHEVACNQLAELGHTIKMTDIEHGYQVEEEVEKFL